MSASSLSVSSPATATVLEGTIPPALFLLVPLFTLALALLALSHRPQQQEKTTNGRSLPQARVAYVIIGVLALLSTLAGALPLSHAGSLQAEAVVQALLSSFLAIPALHLASSSHYYPSSSSSRALLGLLHSSILAITLLGAALLALLLPFLHSSPTTPQYLPPTLFLFYSLLAFPRISWSLYRFLHPATSAGASHIRRPITIHISTQRTSVPLSFSSSVASFSGAQDLAKPNSSVIEERDKPIELAITLPPTRNDIHRSRLNEEDDRDEEEKSHLQAQKHKHDRSLSSTSSTSTITAVDHATRATSNFPLISLTTPPRAAYTSAYIPSFEPIGTLSTHPRIEEHLYRFPDESNAEQSALASEDNEVERIDNKNLRTQLIHNRSRSLLVFLLAAQLTLVVGYSCAVGANISSDSENTVLPLRIVQAACTVLAVTGTMSAYLLHAYNTHLSPSRSRGSRRNRVSLIDSEQPQAQSQMFLSSPFSSSSSATAVSPPATQQLHYQGIQVVEDNSNNARPVLIQLEPPPPPKTRRKRVDATSGSTLHRNHSAYPRSASGSSNSYEEHISIHQAEVDRAYNRRHYSGDVSYIYPYSHSRTPSGQYREPIVLSYEPPKVRTPEDASLLEMTEPEGRGLELDLDFGDGEGHDSEYMDGDLDLDLALEMQKALTLSRSSSRATSKSAWSSRRDHTRAAPDRRRTSASIHAAAARRRSASFQVTTATSKGKNGATRNSRMIIDLPHVNYNGADAIRRKKAKAKEDDPATYIRKRGSLPATPQTKKLFGWEFGWDQLPLPPRSKSTTKSRETEPERNHATFGSVDAATEDSFMDVMKGEEVASQPTRARKLKKRSKSASRHAEAENAIGSQSAAYPLPTKARFPEPAMESPPSSASYNTFGIRRHHGRSPSRPGTPESKKSGGSHGSKSSFGSVPPNIHLQGHDQSHRPVLNLKRSFKMGVGRTLGPSLTLASVDNGDNIKEHRERRIDRDGDFGDELVNEEELDDVDSEIRSIAAAKVVSATIARASPAATIVTAPAQANIATPPPSTSSSSRYNVKYPALIPTLRPVLPAIVTAGATATGSTGCVPFPKSAPPTMKSSPMLRTPSRTKAPHTSGSTWRPHPFADPVESSQTTRRTSVPVSYSNESSTDDDMISLEREMEEIRGLRSGGGQNKMDSPTTQFKELAALMSIPMPAVPALPSPIPSPRKLKGGIFAGQKQPPMSTSPTNKSDWMPISTSSAAGAASISSQEDYPYRFPMFFPGSNSNSPPKVQPTSTNPRGPGSGLRLSAKTMDTVRSAFAGVSARMSMRTSMHSTATGSTKGGTPNGGNFGETIAEDRYGDFMDLCDPFASPPMPVSTIPIAPVVKKKPSKHGSVTREVGDNSWVDSSILEGIEELGTKKMSAWGKLPMPVRSYSPNLGTSSKRHSGNGRVAVVRVVGKPSRRHKKDRRSRKSTLPGSSTKPQSLAEDADFGLEEALLSQRLLSRLDAHGWESRV